MVIEARRIEDSLTETVHVVRPNHLNGANRLFGGILMQWIDEVAGVVAKRHCMMNVTTAAVDNLTFLKGAYQNEMVTIVGKMVSVENRRGERKQINTAMFCMVALDENDKPVRVPRLI